MKPGTVQHTATPWSVGEVIGRGNTQISAMVNGKPIGICSTYRVGIETDPEADAAFIVRAVNCHEDLLGALKLAERRLTDFCDRPDEQGYVVAPDSLERVYLRDIRLTISRASGETK